MFSDFICTSSVSAGRQLALKSHTSASIITYTGTTYLSTIKALPLHGFRNRLTREERECKARFVDWVVGHKLDGDLKWTGLDVIGRVSTAEFPQAFGFCVSPVKYLHMIIETVVPRLHIKGQKLQPNLLALRTKHSCHYLSFWLRHSSLSSQTLPETWNFVPALRFLFREPESDPKRFFFRESLFI